MATLGRCWPTTHPAARGRQRQRALSRTAASVFLFPDPRVIERGSAWPPACLPRLCPGLQCGTVHRPHPRARGVSRAPARRALLKRPTQPLPTRTLAPPSTRPTHRLLMHSAPPNPKLWKRSRNTFPKPQHHIPYTDTLRRQGQKVYGVIPSQVTVLNVCFRLKSKLVV